MEPNTILMGAGAIAFVIVAYLILDSGSSTSSKRVQSIGGGGGVQKRANPLHLHF